MKAKLKKIIVKPAVLALCLAAASLAGAAGSQTNPVREELAENHEGISEETYREILNASEAPDIIASGATALLGTYGTALVGAMAKEYGNFSAEDFRDLARRVDARNAEIAGDLVEIKKKDVRARALYDAFNELGVQYRTKYEAVRALIWAYDELDLEKLDRFNYKNDQLEKFKIEALPAEGESGAMKLKFTNGFKDYHVHRIWFDMGFFAEGKAKPLFLRKDIKYPFMSPVAPGEVREEIVACGKACQKALNADKSAGEFDILRIEGHVPDSFVLVELRKPDDSERRTVKYINKNEVENRFCEVQSADWALNAAKKKIDALLKDD